MALPKPVRTARDSLVLRGAVERALRAELAAKDVRIESVVAELAINQKNRAYEHRRAERT